MTLLLLESIPGIGEKHEIVEIEYDSAMDLLAKRVALIPTPTVRKRFAPFIRERADASQSNE